MKARRIVLVRWTDALEFTAWTEPKDVRNKAMPSASVGFLIREGKDAITLAALQNDHHLGLGITIPRAMIQSIEDLK